LWMSFDGTESSIAWMHEPWNSITEIRELKTRLGMDSPARHCLNIGKLTCKPMLMGIWKH
jgi:hypothetical protein